METRIEYGTDLKLDKEMSIFALCDADPGRQALTALYRRDIEAAGPASCPHSSQCPSHLYHRPGPQVCRLSSRSGI
ncbi:hypothetical protein IV102_23570 [bacterium]|nr:hypothetical protein [bacterium]